MYVFLLVIFFLGCKKESNPDYYIKYVADGQSTIQQAQPNGLWIFINNENSGVTDFRRSNRGVSEFTIGPVKKGFLSKIAVTNACPSSCYIRPLLQIHISQNGEPFVIKKELVLSQYVNDASIELKIE